MAKVQLQFHAETAELLELAEEWIERHGLHGVVQWFTPDFLVRPWPSPSDGVRRICLGLTPFDLNATAPHEFLTRNPDCLVIDIGPHTEEGLRESSLSAATDAAEPLALWRKLIRQTKSRLHSGANVVNPTTGATAPWPRSHHTEGAHTLAAKGVPMLPVAGLVRYEFTDQ
jgi:hypothetical protein